MRKKKKTDCVFGQIPACKGDTDRESCCCCDCGKKSRCKRVCGYLTEFGYCQIVKQKDVTEVNA